MKCWGILLFVPLFFVRGENVREIDKSDMSMAFVRQQVTPAVRTIGRTDVVS
jgi:hypothetical protein